MATRTNIPESIPLTEGHSERTFHESCTEESKKIDDGIEKLPASVENLANTDTMKEEAAGTLQGETLFRSTSPSKEACEETCTISEHDQTDKIINGTKSVVESKNHLQNDQEIQIESGKNEGMEMTKEIEEKGNDNPDDLDTTGIGNPESMIEEISGLEEDKKWITETVQETESKPTKKILDDNETTLRQNTEDLYQGLDPRVSAVCDSEASIDKNFIAKSTLIEPEVEETNLKEKENESEEPFQAVFTSENEGNEKGEVNQIAYDELEDYSISIQKHKAGNENVENILETGDGDIVDNSPVTLINEKTPVEEVIEDKNNLDTPEENTCNIENTEVGEHLEEGNSEHENIIEQTLLQHEAVEEEKLQRDLNVTSEIKGSVAASESVETCIQHEISMNIPDENFEKQVKPAPVVEISGDGVPIEKDLPLLDLNEVAERAQAEISTEAEIDFHVRDSILEDTKQNKQKNDETYTDSTDSVALEHTSTESEGTPEGISVTNNADADDAREKLENEIRKIEDTVDKEKHEIATKCDDTETGCIAGNTLVMVPGLTSAGEELSEQTSSELNSKDGIYSAEGDVKSNINKTEEVHDGPMIPNQQDIAEEQIIEGRLSLHSPESIQKTETSDDGKETEKSWVEGNKEHIIKESDIIAQLPDLVAESPDFHNAENEAEHFKGEVTEETEAQASRSFVHGINPDNENAFTKNQEEKELEEVKETSVIAADINLEDDIEKEMKVTCDSNETGIAEEKDIKLLPDLSEKTEQTDSYLNMNEREASEGKLKMESAEVIEDRDSEKTTEEICENPKIAVKEDDSDEHIIQDERRKLDDDETTKRFKEESHSEEVNTTGEDTRELPKEEHVDFKTPSPIFIEEKILQGSYKEDEVSDEFKIGVSCTDNEKQKIDEYATPVLSLLPDKEKVISESLQECETTELKEQVEHSNLEFKEQTETSENICALNPKDTSVVQATEKMALLAEDEPIGLQDDSELASADFGSIKANEEVTKHIHEKLSMSPEQSCESDDVQVTNNADASKLEKICGLDYNSSSKLEDAKEEIDDDIQKDVTVEQIIEDKSSYHLPESIHETPKRYHDDIKEAEKPYEEVSKDQIIEESKVITKLPELAAESQDFHGDENEAEQFEEEVIEEVQPSKRFAHETNQDGESAEKDYDRSPLMKQEEREQEGVAETDVIVVTNQSGIAEEEDIRLRSDLSKKAVCTDSYLNSNERETDDGELKMDYTLESAEEVEDKASEGKTEELPSNMQLSEHPKIADKDGEFGKHIVHNESNVVITPPQADEDETTKNFNEDEKEDTHNAERKIECGDEDQKEGNSERTGHESCIEELKNIDDGIEKLTSNVENSANPDTVKEEAAGISQGETLLRSTSLSKDVYEETYSQSEHDQIKKITNGTKEIEEDENQLQKLQEIETGSVENQGMENTEEIEEKCNENLDDLNTIGSESQKTRIENSERMIEKTSGLEEDKNCVTEMEQDSELTSTKQFLDINDTTLNPSTEALYHRFDTKVCASEESIDKNFSAKSTLVEPEVEETNLTKEKNDSEKLLKEKSPIEEAAKDTVDEQPVILIKEKAPIEEDKINFDTPTENISNTENDKIVDHLNRENSEHEIIPEKNFLQHNEPEEEKLERDLNVTSEIKESVASSESVETCLQDEISMEIAEERFDKQEKSTHIVEITEHVVPIEKLPDLVAACQDIHDAQNEAEPFKGEVIEETGELQGIHETNQINEISEKDKDSAFSTNEEEMEQGEVKETFVTAASPNLEDNLDKETKETCESNETGIAEEQDIKLLPDLSEKTEHTDSYLNLTERETSAGKLKTDYTLESAIELEDMDSEKTTKEIADKDEDSDKHITDDVNIVVVTPPQSAENETTKSFKEHENEDNNKEVITAEEDTRELIKEELDDFKNPSPMFNEEEILQERYKEDEASDELKIDQSCTDNEEQKISEYVTPVLSSLPDGDKMISENRKECETTELKEQAEDSNLERKEQIETSENIGALHPTDTSIVQTKEKMTMLAEDETIGLQDDSELASIDFESINTNEEVVKHIHEKLSMSPEESCESDDVEVLKEDRTSDITNQSDIFTAEIIKDKYVSNVGDQEARHKNENPPNEPSKCIDESNTFTSSEEVIEQENTDKFEVNLQEFVEEEKIPVELDGKIGSNKTGASTTKESCHLEEENLEPENPEMELECESESVPESSGNKALIESNGTKIVENNNSQYQNTESTDQQTFEPKVQECRKEEDEAVDPKLDDKNNFTDTESARNDVTLTEEIIKETEEIQSRKRFVHEINHDTEISEKYYDGATLTKQETEQGEVTETAVTVIVPNLDENLEKEVKGTHDSNQTGFSKEEDIELLPETRELSERSMSKELVEKEPKEIIDEVGENSKIASMEDDSDKHIVRNESAAVVISPQSVGEQTSKSSKEGEEENHDNDEVTNAGEETREWINEETNVFKNQSRLSKEDGILVESYKEDEVCDQFKIVESRSIDSEKQTIDEYATPVLCSLADKEKVISESSVECETKANELKDEVEDSPLELNEQVQGTTDSTGSPKLEILKDREYRTENFAALNPKDTIDTETLQTENNEILVKPFIFPDETEKRTNVDILEKQEPTINDSETAFNAVDTALLKCSKQIEPEKVVCGMAYIESDDQSHETEEHKLITNNVNPVLDGTLEKMSLQEENESICLRDDSELASVDFKISNTNKEVAKYNPEKLSMTSDLSSVSYACGSEDVGILKKEEASEITPESDTSPLETLKDEDLSNVGDQKDMSKNEKSLNGASRCVEVLGTLPSSEKDIKQENAAKLFGDLEDVTGEDKIQAELEANILREESLASEIKETPALEEENIELSDPGKELKCASELVPENFGNKTPGETSEIEIGENEPDVQECEKVVGEIVGPKLDDEKSNTQSAINTEEIPMVYDKIDVKEDIAELIIQNERGITEYHSLSSGDETYHEVEKCDQPQVQTVENVTSHTDGPPNETTMERLEDDKTVADFPIHIPQVSEEIIDIASTIVVKQDKISEESLLHDITEKAEERSEPTSVGEGVDILKCEDTSESMLTTLSRIQDEKSDLAPTEILQATELSSQLEIVNSGEESSSKDGDVPLITKESNEVAIETQDNKKPVDFSILLSEVSEENVEQKIIEQGDNYSDKLNPEEGFLNVTKDSTLTETCPEIEGADNMNFDETTNSMSKFPITECEDVDKETVHVEKQVMDEIEDVEKASRVVVEETEIPAHVVFETLRSLPMEETNADEFEKDTAQSHGEGQILDMGDKCKETSNFQCHESGETEIDKARDACIVGLATEGNQSDVNECIKREILNNEITEKRESAMDSQQKNASEETIENINQANTPKVEESPIEKTEDTLRIEQVKSENEELSEGIQKVSSSMNILVQETHEDRAVKYQDSVFDERNNGSPPDETERNNFKEAATVLDLENEFDRKKSKEDLEARFLLSEEVAPHSELSLDTEDINYIKETTITESEEEPNTDLSVRQATDTESAINDVTLTKEVIKETGEVQSCKSFVHEINQDTEISEKDYDRATLTKQEREQGELTETAVTVAVPNLDDDLEKEVKDAHDSNQTGFSKEEDIELLPETMALTERSMSNELVEKESKEIIDEVCEIPKIASMEDDSDKNIVQNESAAVVISQQLVGEETSKSSKEGEEENHDNDEVINAGEDTREWLKDETNVFKNQSRLSKEDETVEESYEEYEVCEEFKIVESRSIDNEKQTIDEYATPVLCSLADEEKVISESSVECETKANELKEEVEDSPLDLNEQVETTTDSTGSPKLEILKDREYRTENFAALNPKDTLDPETLQTENNEILVKPFIFPDETEKRTNVDILEKQDPTINDSETASNAIDTALLKCSKQIEPEKVVCGMAYIESDDQSHETEEHKLMTNNVNPVLDGTLEKMSLQEENESLCPRDDSELASVDFKISNTNKEVAKYSPEKLSMTSDLSSGSEDVGILKKEEASEITPESDTSPLETLKDEDLSNVGDQDDISKNENSLNGASRCVEVLGTLPSSEKDIKQENAAKLSEDLEDVTGEGRIQADLKANILREESLASQIKETPALAEENIELSDPGKELQCAFESVPENFGNKTLGETSETEIIENEPGVHECEKVVGEIVRPKLDDGKSITQSAIHTEEIEDSFGIKTGEDKGIQNEAMEEEGDTSTEDSKINSQEVDPDINNMDSLPTEKNNEPKRTTEQSSLEVSKYDEVFDIENLNKDDDCPLTAQSQGDGQILDMGEKCKETSDFQCHESGETEIDKARDARIVGLATEGNQSDGNECIKREILNEEITENRESSIDSQQNIVSEETIENINEADKLKVEESPRDKTEDTQRIKQVKSENEELSEETQKVSSSMNILIQNTHEDRAVKDQDLVFDERNNESPPDEAEGNNFKEAATELDLENEFDRKYSKEGTEIIFLSEKVAPHSELALDTEDINYIKETTITENEEDSNTDLSVRQATCPATVEAGREIVGENFEKFALVNNQESFMDYEKLDDTSHQSPNNGLEVKEKLKFDQEVIPETENTYVSESSQEETPDDQMNIKEDDKKHDLIFDKNIEVESITEERVIINDEKEQTESKQPLEESTRETHKKPHDADVDNTTYKSTNESENLSECPDIPSPNISMLQKGGIANLSGANETTQNIKEPEKISDCKSEKQIPEKYHNEIEDTIVATCDKYVQLLPDDLEKTEIERFKPRNSVKVESEQEVVKCNEEKRTVDDRNISLSSLLEMSTRETLQMHGQVSEVKEKTRPNEETQTEKADALQEEVKTDEEKCEEDEHKNNESISDSLVMVEASKVTAAKVVQKKHHGFISGVGSKVKHSISKVKKAITGKSSHSKSTSPKS